MIYGDILANIATGKGIYAPEVTDFNRLERTQTSLSAEMANEVQL